MTMHDDSYGYGYGYEPAPDELRDAERNESTSFPGSEGDSDGDYADKESEADRNL